MRKWCLSMLFWMCERRERQKTKTQKKGRGSGERTVTVTPGVEVSYGTPGSTGGVEVRWLELMAGSRSESVRGCVWCGGVGVCGVGSSYPTSRSIPLHTSTSFLARPAPCQYQASLEQPALLHQPWRSSRSRAGMLFAGAGLQGYAGYISGADCSGAGSCTQIQC